MVSVSVAVPGPLHWLRDASHQGQREREGRHGRGPARERVVHPEVSPQGALDFHVFP